jgi:hypothetical protein
MRDFKVELDCPCGRRTPVTMPADQVLTLLWGEVQQLNRLWCLVTYNLATAAEAILETGPTPENFTSLRRGLSVFYDRLTEDPDELISRLAEPLVAREMEPVIEYLQAQEAALQVYKAMFAAVPDPK